MNIKYFIFGFVVFLILAIIGCENNKAFEQCVEAGIQSNETCARYAYQ